MKIMIFLVARIVEFLQWLLVINNACTHSPPLPGEEGGWLQIAYHAPTSITGREHSAWELKSQLE